MGEKANRDEVISNLRACLLSAKGGISFSCLNDDYRKIVGENIPFKKLGYQSLNAFLNDIPGLSITKQGGDWNVVARPTEDTAHLAALISRQKTASKKRSRRPSVKHRRPTANLWKPPVMVYRGSSTHSAKKDQQTINRVNQSNKTSNITPLMAIQQTKPIPSLFDKLPRYMVPNNGTPQTSPSKRFSDRMANSSVNSHIQPSGGPNNQTTIVYKSKTAVQAVQNEKLPHTSTPIASPVMPVNKLGQSSTRYSEPAATQPKPVKSINERLTLRSQPNPQPPTILSPLSPIQLITSAQSALVLTPPPTPKPPTQNNWSLSPKHQDPSKQLEILTNNMNLPAPVYKVASYAHKRQQMIFICKVEIGTESFSSWPDESKTEEEAKNIAASKAIKEILDKNGPLCGLLETTDKILVKERVVTIVAEHENGVFMHQIPNYYKEKFRENLPSDWDKIIEECSEIFKETGAHDSTILCPYVPRSDINESDKAVDTLSPRVDKIQLNPIGPPVPAPLKPPAEPYWDVCICSVRSTTELWARLIGEEYSDKFENMMNELEAHYKKLGPSLGPTGIEIGNYYAIQEEDAWHRVHCFDFDPKTGEAAVFFIDHGDDDNFHYSKLFPLEKKFCNVPAQAVKLSLVELEEFEDCPEVSEYLDELLEETLVAEVVGRQIEGEEVTASVVLYDTKHSTDINLNEVLLNKICQNILVPKLNKNGQVSEVYVSHITDTGDVYLQVKSNSMRHLVNLMNKLIKAGLPAEDVQRSETKKIDTNQIYLARSAEDGNWYRAIVTDFTPNRIKVFLVDMGRTTTVEKKHLLVLSQLSGVLAKYPHQALKVRLHNIPNSMFNGEMAAKLAVLAPPQEQLLAKVVTSASRSSPPLFELFKRFGPNNILMSINNTLAIDPDLIGSNGDGNNNTRPKKRTERSFSRYGTTSEGESITKSLKPPAIPDFGRYFDVHITLAANPGNFTVQPYDDRVRLEAMMVQLQEACLNYKGPCPSHESVKEGNLYAARHRDTHYYRVCILKVMSDQTVTVYYCDFGDVKVHSLTDLQPLGRHFLDLPYQAIRARLFGVQPVNIDWSVEDCVRFQELVVEKNFVSIVVDSGPDRLSPGDTVLGLKLIDVSGDTDVYLDKLLIDEGCATAVDV